MNHWEIVREIEETLNEMQISFNISNIIQMGLTQKLNLRDKIRKLWFYTSDDPNLVKNLIP